MLGALANAASGASTIKGNSNKAVWLKPVK
jgi:hypothetical protein